MALSGSLNTNAYDGRYYQIRWTATQSIANNSSTINWTVSALGGGTRWFAERTLKVVIAGKTVINKEDRVERYDGDIASGSFTIAHAADGSKTIPVSIQAAVYTSTINCVASTTYTLDQIPKQAIITGASNFTDEDALTVTYRNSAGNAVTSLDMAIGWTGADDIKYRSVSKTGTSYTFNFTSAEQIKLQDAVTGSNSKIVTIYLRTVINGTTYYSTIQKTLSIANAEPYVNPVLTEQNSGIAQATGSSNIMIIGQSKIYCVSNATARKRASIVSVKIKNGTKVINAASGTFNNAESQNFIFEATDSRGYTVTKTITRQAVNYFPPTIRVNFIEFATNGTASFSAEGIYFNQYFSSSYANTLFTRYRIAVVGESYGGWQNFNHTLSGNSYTSNFNITGLDYTKSYKVEFQANDRFNEVKTAEIRFTGRPIFEWSKNDFKFNVPVNFAAGATGVDGGSSNTSLSGTWTPMLDTTAISSYTTRQGWYQRIGNVITVGFFVKATCKSGYNTTNVVINGLPFTPEYSAAGSGMCAGAYMSAGFNFMAFVAETSGNITTRVQQNNNTSAGNVSTSASGCFYPSGGGEITLSGTICYTV